MRVYPVRLSAMVRIYFGACMKRVYISEQKSQRDVVRHGTITRLLLVHDRLWARVATPTTCTHHQDHKATKDDRFFSVAPTVGKSYFRLGYEESRSPGTSARPTRRNLSCEVRSNAEKSRIAVFERQNVRVLQRTSVKRHDPRDSHVNLLHRDHPQLMSERTFFRGWVDLRFAKTAKHFHFGSVFRADICRWGKGMGQKILKSEMSDGH